VKQEAFPGGQQVGDGEREKALKWDVEVACPPTDPGCGVAHLGGNAGGVPVQRCPVAPAPHVELGT